MAKRWKSTTLNWSALQLYDDSDVIGVCLTQRQVAILKALLMPAYWVTRWENLAVSKDVLTAYISNIDDKLDGEDCELNNMEFRDNPSDPCEVQYSNDSGGTWTTMFRKDVCQATSLANLQTMYVDIDNIENNNTTWSNDILNVAPDWAYVDTNSDRALCWAIRFYVDWACETAIKQIKSENDERREQNDWVKDAGEILSAAVLVAVATVAAPITMPVLAVSAVTWATTRVVEDVWDFLVTKDYSNFEDEEARDFVACQMFRAQTGITPQFPNWRDSLQNYGQWGNPEDQVGELVNIFNQEEDVYINYMLVTEDLNTIAATLPDCNCPETGEFDQLQGPNETERYGTELTFPTSVELGRPGGDFVEAPGVYSETMDWYGDIVSPIGGVACNIAVKLPLNVLVTQVKVGWLGYRPLITTAGDKLADVWLGAPDAGGVHVGDWTWPSTTGVEQRIVGTYQDGDGLTTTPVDWLYIHNSMDKGTGAAKANVYWVHVEWKVYVAP